MYVRVFMHILLVDYYLDTYLPSEVHSLVFLNKI